MGAEDNNEREQVSAAQLVKRLRENLVAQIELQVLLAKIDRAKYRALIDEGFTEQQALELCKR